MVVVADPVGEPISERRSNAGGGNDGPEDKGIGDGNDRADADEHPTAQYDEGRLVGMLADKLQDGVRDISKSHDPPSLSETCEAGISAPHWKPAELKVLTALRRVRPPHEADQDAAGWHR